MGNCVNWLDIVVVVVVVADSKPDINFWCFSSLPLALSLSFPSLIK